MVQMTAQDRAIVMALPGNKLCCDCGAKNPQWASVSFGNVFCLICSGVHRSLGVHISFVRSVAMDSWTDKQLAAMKKGGNDNCNNYLKKHGIDPKTTPIKEKYESAPAQLYKEVLKARVEGRPEPTEMPKAPPKRSASASGNFAANGGGGFGGGGPGGFGGGGRGAFGGSGGGGGGGGGSNDPNGMERLIGETDQEYIKRQTRLREEARARMAAKFGNSGRMGGVGSSGSGMSGMGSDPSYNPNGGYGVDVDSVVSGVGSAFATMGFMAASATKNVSSFIQDENTQKSLSNIKSSVAPTVTSFWGGLTSTVKDVGKIITQPDDYENDGLSQLQREFAQKKQAAPSNPKYSGFGSDNLMNNFNNSSNNNMQMNNMMSGNNNNEMESPGLPGEDRNGIQKLTGESDQQYIARQTRIRDEAKARMAAKFGGGGLSSASSSNNGFSSTMSNSNNNSMSGGGGFGTVSEAVGLPGEDRNGIQKLTGESDEQYVMRQTRIRDEAKARMAAKFGGGGLSSASSSTYNNNNNNNNNFSTAPSTNTSFTAPKGMSLNNNNNMNQIRSAPTSGNFTGIPHSSARAAPVNRTAPAKKLSGDDFFASFGT